MDENPYAPPGDESQGEPASVLVDPEAVRRSLRFPAGALVLLAVIAMLLDIGVITNTVLSDAPVILKQHGRERGIPMIIANTGTNALIMLIHLLVLLGAKSMLRLRSYSNARAAALVSIVPFCSPVLVLGIPFGVWALVVLARPQTKAAFDINVA